MDCDYSHEIKRHLLLGRKAMTNLDCVLKSRDITLLTKVHIVKAMIFPVFMYGCESWHKEGWGLKKWCFSTAVLEKTLENSLDGKEFKPINPKENHPWIFIERTDDEAPILWLPDAKNRLIGKDPAAGKDWRQGEKGVTEDERFYGITDSMTCVWANSGRWWAGKPGVLQFIGSQQYVNHKLPDVQAGFRKGRGSRDHIANIRRIMEQAREFQKNIYFCFIDYAKALRR